MNVNCVKCDRSIAVTDVIESSAGRLSHLDCARSQIMTAEERALLFIYCSEHVVTKCVPCGLEYRITELAADLLGNGRTNLCPRCRMDLTASLRAHLFACGLLPEAIRLRMQEVRDAAQLLVRRNQELNDESHGLIREAEAALFERQRALREAMSRGEAS